MRAEAEKEVDRAIAFADASPEPAPEDALTDVYVAYR
jgi:TPP-dependent pyruvate/acetoin dehydrogenase alpha subunit